MAERPLQELLAELENILRSGGKISLDDRALLERVRVDVEVALASQPVAAVVPPETHTLREGVREALDRLQVEHPRLSSLLSRTLDALSDVGV